jgi:PPP family 3-phenylpropionic acid transporter
MIFIPAHITFSFVYGIILAYLPILLRNHGYRPGVVGAFLAIAEGAGILGPFLFGQLADKHGKYKNYIILGYLITAAAAMPLAFIINPLASAILSALIVVGYRSTMPLIDAMTTVNLGEKGNYGKIRVSGSISFVCFTFFIQWVPVLRPNEPVNISLWICITAIFAIIVNICMPSKYARRKLPLGASQSNNNNKGSIQKKSIWTPFFIMGLTIIALSRLAMSPVYSFLSLFLVEYIHWDAIGLMLTLAGISEIPFLFFSDRLIRRFGAMPILAFASAMVALRLGLYAVFPFKTGVIFAQLLHSFCYGLFHPAAIAFISNCVPPEQRSFGMSLYFSLGCGIPTLIGSFFGGLIIDFAGYICLFKIFSVFAILGTAIYVVYQSTMAFTNRVKQQ